MRTLDLKKAVTAIFLALTGFMSHAAMEVTLTDASAAGGSAATVEVELTADTPLSGLQLLFDVPGGCDISLGNAEGAGRAAAFSASAGIREGRGSVMLFNASGATIAAGKGLVARFAVNYGNKPLDATVGVTVKAVDAAGAMVAVPSASLRLLCRQPQATYSVRAIDFGRVPLGTAPTLSMNVTNEGTAPLTVSGLEFDNAEFTSTAVLPFTVAPGAAMPLEVKFAPSERGTVDAAVKVLCNSPQTYNTVRLLGRPFAVNEVHVADAAGTAGDEVTVALNMNNMDAVNGFTMEFDLPDALEYVPGSFVLGERGAAHSLSVNCTGKRLVANAYSLTNEPFAGSDGAVATFRVRLQGKGYHSLALKKCRLSAFYRGEIMDVTSDTYAGGISISYPSISVQSDLSLGRTPVTQTANTELEIHNYGNAPLTIERAVPDNDNVEVATPLPLTVEPWSTATLRLSIGNAYRGDVDGRLSIYSNDPERKMVDVAFTGNRYSPNELHFGVARAAAAGADGMVAVVLANNDAVSGLQFDVRTAGGVSLGDAAATARMDGFTVTRRTLADGTERFFVYSLGGAAVARGSGLVLNIPYSATAAAEQPFEVCNVRISTPDLENVSSLVTGHHFLLGDVDANGTVNVVDITSLARHISQGLISLLNSFATDVNFDSAVNVADITGTANIILQK
ncbi:MAG: choice-of-anchor D domain-containing protein [Muribaculaceae bacterium]|nr:choice-of-anchor D domain-containing protein [Muribaculaceae bacterium]